MNIRHLESRLTSGGCHTYAVQRKCPPPENLTVNCAFWDISFNNDPISTFKDSVEAKKELYLAIWAVYTLQASLKMHVSPISKIFSNVLNRKFWGIFWSVFPSFALQKGPIFGTYTPYLRVGFQISKWHTRIQKSGKNPPAKISLVISYSHGLQASKTRLNMLLK